MMFASPDTIVPEPYQPIDWNRYQYVRANPLKYTDPSGHCSGDPNNDELSGRDQACWDYWSELGEKYNNVNIDSRFTLAQLKRIGTSLDAAFEYFGSDLEIFKRAYGDFSIMSAKRVSRAVTLGKTIFLGSNTFVNQKGVSQKDAVQIIIHEMSHIFDFHGGGGGGRWSNYYEDHLSTTECNPGALGCSDGDFPLYDFVNAITGGSGKYTTSGGSPYGNKSSIDDFAESLTYMIMSNKGLQTNISIDSQRQVYIQVITDYVKLGP